jgi:hypothetical protein
MKKNILNTAFFLTTSFTAQAEIIESSSIMSVLNYITTPKTLVVYDIDNTLARPEQELGSDEWFCYVVNQKIAEGLDYIDAINAALPVCYYAQFNLPLVATESAIPTLLTTLAEQQVYTMGLTARGLFLAERTHEQLINININFCMPEISSEELVLPMKYPCLYKYNIIFSSNNDKGETLLRFLDTINYHPDRIVFVDDKLYHVQAVEKAALSRNIEYVGIRYSACDEYINHFDPVKADIQLQMLRQHNRMPAQQHHNNSHIAAEWQ